MAGVIATIPKYAFQTSTGAPLASGVLYTYLAGTTTPVETFSNKALSASNGTSITLDARGECTIWLDDTKTYKFVLKDSAGSTIWTEDDISGPLSYSSLGFGSATLAGFYDSQVLATYAALRAYTGSAKSAYITGYLASSAPSYIAGEFTRDDSDTTSSDNAATVIVDSSNRRWKRRFDGPVNVKWFGAIGDGTTDDTTAFNAAIAQINLGVVDSLRIPAGDYLISAELTTLTADGWSIFGDGIQTTRLTMDASAGTEGTFFRVGSSTEQVQVFTMDGFEMYANNHLTLNGSGNPIEFSNAAQGVVSNIKAFRTNGLFTLGSTAWTTLCNSTNFLNCRGIPYAAAGGASLDLQSYAGCKFTTCGFTATGTAGTAAASFRGLRAHPSSTDTADSIKFVSCDWNYPGAAPVYNLEYDGTNSSSGNQQFVNCVFDQAENGANFYCHIDAGAVSAAKLGITCSCCISNGSTGTDAILIDNTGGGKMTFIWQGGHISQKGNSQKAVKVIGSNPVTVKIAEAELVSRSSGVPESPIFIGDGVSGVQILNCTAVADFSNAALGTPAVAFTYLVTFEGAATNCIIEGNDLAEGAGALVQWTAMPSTGLETIRIRNNLGPTTNRLPFTASTTDATPTTVYTYALTDERSYLIRARVHAQNSSGSNRAMYEVAGLFYRDAGGAATLEGSLASLISIESVAGWDATLTASGNNVTLVITGGAGVTINWRFDIEITEAI